jgi:hypothetical protein
MFCLRGCQKSAVGVHGLLGRIDAIFGFEEFVVRTSPSIAPNGREKDVYLVLDDFGRLGWAWRETDVGVDREAVIRDLLSGQLNNPVRVITFNIAEGWCRDVTVDIADELRRRYVEYDEVPEAVLEFLEANQARRSQA